MKQACAFSKWAALSLILAFGLVSAPSFAAAPFLIGVISPMSGPMATVGTNSTVAIQLWAKTINADGGIKGRQVDLDICDDHGSPEIAVTCVRRQEGLGIGLILDNSVSSTIRGITPMLAQGPVMVVASPIVNPDPKSYVFQTSPTDLEITEALLAYLKENKVSKLAMIAATDTTGEANAKNAEAVLPPAGVKLSLARIDLGANDASIQLANIVKDNPIIYSAYSGAGAATVVKSFTNLGLTIPFVISNANLTDSFMALIKENMPRRLLGLGLNMLVPELVKDPQDRARIKSFEQAYEAEKGEKTSLLALQGLMLGNVAQAVLENVDDLKDPEAIRKFLENNPIKSISPLRFTAARHVGMGPDTVSVMEYKNGHWTKADPIN